MTLNDDGWAILVMAVFCVVGIGGYLLINIFTHPDSQERQEDKRRRKYRDQFEDN